MVATVIAYMVTAFIVGAFARWAVPGPDPMPAWLTIAIGIGGSAIGYGIVLGTAGRHALSWAGIASFVAAVGLVLAYRHFVQKRPLWGKDAYRFPERGFGVEAYRDRLKRAGIDPDKIGTRQFGGMASMQSPQQPPVAVAGAHSGAGDPTENPAYYLGLLEALHDSGVLDDDEYTSARLRLLERLRS
jgi:uncharacterized membrane protein YeaQ/YmgE (transglycosylase-associated protein family)